MRTLNEYTHIVSEIEAGRHPPGFSGKQGIDKLIVEMCFASWKMPDDRSKVQALAARLARLKERS
jgi:hypothetical protein